MLVSKPRKMKVLGLDKMIFQGGIPVQKRHNWRNQMPNSRHSLTISICQHRDSQSFVIRRRHWKCHLVSNVLRDFQSYSERNAFATFECFFFFRKYVGRFRLAKLACLCAKEYRDGSGLLIFCEYSMSICV